MAGSALRFHRRSSGNDLVDRRWDSVGDDAGMCSPQELKVTINGSASPSGAQVIANPTHAGTYIWDDSLLSLGGSHVIFVSDSVVIGSDTDADGLANRVDNCPTVANPDQLNTDSDTLGNACDTDDDNDGFSDVVELSAGTNPLLDAASTPGLRT